MLGAQRQIVKVSCRAMSQQTGRPSPMVDKFIRVDHAGEIGADRIYAGQMAVLGKSAKKLHNFCDS
jgi:demethoxyubiquinone hydroxylase (CLK1/Coq7/Cat5 family)